MNANDISGEDNQLEAQTEILQEKGRFAPEEDSNGQEFTFQSTGSDNPFFVRDLQYTRAEEAQVIRILDMRLFPWVLLTTFVLNMDRTNNSNAISDNLPQDLGFNINVVNTATAIYSVLFSIFCLSGAVISKKVGPSRWIPILMFAWGLVTLAHALIKNKAGYLTVRCFIAITEGGVIPATLVYLSGFYKGTELATRLAWFWGVQTIASAVSGLMASGLLQLRGVAGLEGWKWLFIVDGIITVIVAIGTWFYLPRNLLHTKGGIRGFKPWLSDRQVRIAVTRVIRDDPSKGKYETTTVKWSDVLDAITDLGLWGHLILTAIGLTPTTPLSTYLPTVIKTFNFSVFAANALTAPPYVLQCITSVIMIWHSDRVQERGLHGAFGACWQLVGWILLRALPDASRGVKYFGAIVVASWPSTHPLNIAWMLGNTASVGKRTIASGAVIGFANIYGVWGSQIYQASDAPGFKVGNTVNIVFSGVAFLLWFVQKFYYVYRNAQNKARWISLTEEKKREEDLKASERGNRSGPPSHRAHDILVMESIQASFARNHSRWISSSTQRVAGRSGARMPRMQIQQTIFTRGCVAHK